MRARACMLFFVRASVRPCARAPVRVRPCVRVDVCGLLSVYVHYFTVPNLLHAVAVNFGLDHLVDLLQHPFFDVASLFHCFTVFNCSVGNGGRRHCGQPLHHLDVVPHPLRLLVFRFRYFLR